MTDDLLELASGLIDGTISVEDHPPVSIGAGASGVEVDDGILFVESFANVTAIEDSGELVLVDSGSPMHAGAIHDTVRSFTRAPCAGPFTPTATWTTASVSGCSRRRPALRTWRWWHTRRCPSDSTATA